MVDGRGWKKTCSAHRAKDLAGAAERPRRDGIIENALAGSRGRVAGPDGAAAKLGIPRSTLESKIRSLRIDKNRFRSG